MRNDVLKVFQSSSVLFSYCMRELRRTAKVNTIVYNRAAQSDPIQIVWVKIYSNSFKGTGKQLVIPENKFWQKNT